jgi:hypothetical protein
LKDSISVIRKEYLVDKPSTAKLRVKSMSKDLIEALLVMIIVMAAGIIHATNIKDSIQRITDLRESSTRKEGIQVSAIAGYTKSSAVSYTLRSHLKILEATLERTTYNCPF